MDASEPLGNLPWTEVPELCFPSILLVKHTTRLAQTQEGTLVGGRGRKMPCDGCCPPAPWPAGGGEGGPWHWSALLHLQGGGSFQDESGKEGRKEALSGREGDRLEF